MNKLTLIGQVAGPPSYYCTEQARDLARFVVVTTDRRGGRHEHHCLTYGPAALSVMDHLRTGDWILVKGEQLYRQVNRNGKTERRPYVLLRGFSYLNAALGISAAPARAAPASASPY